MYLEIPYGARAAREEPEDFSLDAGNESDRSSTSSSRKGRRVYLSDDDWESDEAEQDDEQSKWDVAKEFAFSSCSSIEQTHREKTS